MSGGTRPWLALLATLLVQLLASTAMSAGPVLAPAVAPSFGLAPERVGVFQGVIYLCAMVVGLGSGPWVARLGPTRLMQCVLLAMAGALALAAVGSTAWILVAAAALMGVGYGAVNPAAAVILGHHAPPGSPGLFFAVKQAAVPMGIAVGGVAIPVAFVAFGWRGAAFAVALACVVMALLLLPLAKQLDVPRGPSTGGDRVAWLAVLRRVMAHRELRRLSFVSFSFAMAQQGFLTFSVSMLTLQMGMPLAAAAGLLAASQVAATLMRIALGHVADRWVAPATLLGVLGLAMAASCIALSALSPGATLAVTAIAMVACGGTTMGWNGVYFAQLLRSVPRAELAGSTGGTQFFIFGGAMAGPFLFGQVIHLGVSYAAAYGCLALVAGAAGLAMLRGSRAGQAAPVSPVAPTIDPP